METMRESRLKVAVKRLKVAGDEQGSNVLIKREVEWFAEDSRPPGLAFQELKLDKELLLSTKTDEDPFHTDAEANAVPSFTPVPQTDVYLKTELILDEESIDNMNNSEANCKQNVKADSPLVGAGLSVKKSETGELSSPSNSPKRTRNVKVHMPSKHLGEAQSITSGPPITDDDSINSNPRSTFICEECGSSFTRKSNLKTHILRKHFDKAQARFECGIGSRSFTIKRALKVHLRIHSQDRRRDFACDLCGKSFYEKSKLNWHKKIHTIDGYACKVCGDGFTRKESLKRHIVRRQHFDQPHQFTAQSSNNDVTSIKTELMSDKEFIGEANGSESVSHSEATQQLALAGDNNQQTGVNTAVNSMTCEFCQNSYPGELIKAHLRLTHNNKCQFCSLSFTTKAVLKEHLRIHSQDRRRNFACGLCGKNFRQKHKLNRHKKIHTGDRYVCKVCGYGFTQKESLKRHMVRRQHFDEPQQFTLQSSNNDVASMKIQENVEEFIDEGNGSESVSHSEATQQPTVPGDNIQQTGVDTAVDSVTCEVCHNTYPGELIKTHMRVTHSEKAYKCQFCSKVYWKITAFEKHISRHNDNRPVPYACEQCGFKFVSKANLKNHMVTHTKYRKPEFDCELCEKKFFSRSGLKQHLKTHTGETVSCEVCGTHFVQTQGLKRHILRKHTGKTEQFPPDSQTANDDSV